MSLYSDQHLLHFKMCVRNGFGGWLSLYSDQHLLHFKMCVRNGFGGWLGSSHEEVVCPFCVIALAFMKGFTLPSSCVKYNIYMTVL